MGQAVRKELVRIYTQLGAEALAHAYKKGHNSKVSPKTGEKVWQNRTYRLLDSMGSAVYIDGVLQRESIRTLTQNLSIGNSHDSLDTRSGTQVLNEYFEKTRPMAGKNDIVLVVVAAMYYSQYLENGWHGGGYKIQVISAARDYVNRNYWSRVQDIYKRFNMPPPSFKIVKGDSAPRRAWGIKRRAKQKKNG